ncbi:MAG: chemotaxis protein CheW [Actinomycetota bacterium]
MGGQGESRGADRSRTAVRERLHARLAATADAAQAHAVRFAEAVLEMRARRLAAIRAAAAEPAAGTAALCFRVAGEHYGLPLADLAEVLPLNAWTPVPGQPQYLLGVTNVRGEIRPVLDLHSLLGMAAPDAGARSYVVFLQRDGAEVGLRVDALDRIRFVEHAGLTVPHEAANGLPQRFVAGITADTLILLDPRQILALDVLQDRRADYRRAC